MSSLKGKKALVTGGSRGIGAAIALRLAEEGADVAITYSKSPDAAEAIVAQIKATGGKAYAVKADALQPDTITAPVGEAIAALGGIDILVNNAGIFELGMIGEVTPETLERTLSVNVRSVFLTTQAAVAVMKDGGRVINIGSVLGERAIGAGMSVYNMSKFAVQGLTRSWAHDLAPCRITVNVVQPGPIDTDMNPDDGEFAAQMKQAVPLKRYGKAHEVAAAVAFLASDDASYVNGAIINVDGGMNA